MLTKFTEHVDIAAKLREYFALLQMKEGLNLGIVAPFKVFANTRNYHTLCVFV